MSNFWFSSILSNSNLNAVIDDKALQQLAMVENEGDFCSVRLFIELRYQKGITTILEFLTYQMFFHSDVAAWLLKYIHEDGRNKNLRCDYVYLAQCDYFDYLKNHPEECEEYQVVNEETSTKIDWMDIVSKLKQ